METKSKIETAKLKILVLTQGSAEKHLRTKPMSKMELFAKKLTAKNRELFLQKVLS